MENQRDRLFRSGHYLRLSKHAARCNLLACGSEPLRSCRSHEADDFILGGLDVVIDFITEAICFRVVVFNR